jgi:hypothetical protein
LNFIRSHLGIIHILAGPFIGILITALGFADEVFIQGSLKAFFLRRRTSEDRAAGIETMISGVIALATFFANCYIFIINCFLAVIVFPFPSRYSQLIFVIGEVVALILLVQLFYIRSEYSLLYIGDRLPFSRSKFKIFRTMTYARFLLWEQAGFNVVTSFYFALGILLAGPETRVVA